MTAIADKIRALLGLTGTMGLDAMAAHLGTEQANVNAALSVISEKGVSVPEGSTSNSLASLIASIEAGGGLVRVGTIVSGYQQIPLDIRDVYPNYASITVDDIYLVPSAFEITQSGSVSKGAYNLNKAYDPANGVLTAWRDALPGSVGVSFNMEVFVSANSGALK